MSFREKLAWLGLIVHSLVFGVYFLVLSRNWNVQIGQGLSIGLVIAAVIALVVITVALTVVAAILSPKEANVRADERETLVDLKAERVSSYVLSTGVVCLIGALLLGWNGFLVANLLLAALVAAELVKAGAQILHFRRGV
jgi:predicted RND superfamily exporter protein